MAKAIVEIKREAHDGTTLVPVEIRCSECTYIIFTAVPARLVETAGELIDYHLEQHEPGRALDIEIEWILSASCSVCDDGGDIEQDSTETVICNDCNTTWTIDGTDGELDE